LTFKNKYGIILLSKPSKRKKMKIQNTLAFEPTVTEDFEGTIVPAPQRGQIFVVDGEVTKGCEIVALIKANPDDKFLVSKPVFDHLSGLGYSNVCMFDPEKTVYDNGRAIAQGGLIFS
jgi:hypothetical protein